MKATALKTTLGGALALALIGGATLASVPASADPVKNAVYRSDDSAWVVEFSAAVAVRNFAATGILHRG